MGPEALRKFGYLGADSKIGRSEQLAFADDALPPQRSTDQPQRSTATGSSSASAACRVSQLPVLIRARAAGNPGDALNGPRMSERPCRKTRRAGGRGFSRVKREFPRTPELTDLREAGVFSGGRTNTKDVVSTSSVYPKKLVAKASSYNA